MKNRLWERAVSGLLTAGLTLYPCSVSNAAGNGISFDSMYEVFQEAKRQESALTGENPETIPDSRFIVENRWQNDVRILSISGQCLNTDKEQFFYAVGKNYEPEGSILPVVYGDQIEYSRSESFRITEGGNEWSLIRFALNPVPEEDEKEDPRQEDSEAEDSADKSYWSLGETVYRKIGGIRYRFRCIDQNYQGKALFLCDSVIPADTGSDYVYERLEDGSHGYVFHPGPIVNFGDSSEYKDSRIRMWLKEQEDELETSPPVDVGVTRSYMGRTAAGSYSQFDPQALSSHDMGGQRLMDRLFILSVDEAMTYKDHLWDVQIDDSVFAGAYWLRSPMGTGDGQDTGYVYVADLRDGSIRPQAIKPGYSEDDSEDEELAATSPVGIRPAFVLPQRD